MIGPGPYSIERSYTPSPHPCDEYLAMLDAVGLDHGVLVQPTVHGTDNSLMLAALRQWPERLRGIAVVPDDLGEHELQALDAAGVKGLRVVAAARGGVGLARLDRYDAICAEMGWHLQVMIDASRIGEASNALSLLRAPLVIDHMGYFPASEGVDSQAVRLLQSLLRDGAWVKLSGAFRLAKGDPYAEVVPIAHVLIDAAPDRCIWGSDWPHVGFWGLMPNIGSLLDLVVDWAPDALQRRKIFVDNPHRLYGFGHE